MSGPVTLQQYLSDLKAADGVTPVFGVDRVFCALPKVKPKLPYIYLFSPMDPVDTELYGGRVLTAPMVQANLHIPPLDGVTQDKLTQWGYTVRPYICQAALSENKVRLDLDGMTPLTGLSVGTVLPARPDPDTNGVMFTVRFHLLRLGN